MKLLKYLLLLTVSTNLLANKNNFTDDELKWFLFNIQTSPTFGRNINKIKNFLKKYPTIVNCYYSDSKKTALHFAIEAKDLEIINLLLKSKADVNATTSWGENSLHLAALNNKFNEVGDDLVEIFKLILKNKPNIEAKDKMEMTPIFYALFGGPIEFLHLLIKEGANVNAQSNQGCPPMYWAINNGQEFVKTLIKAGANVNIKDKNDSTPLHYIIETFPTSSEYVQEIIKLFIAANANINSQDCDQNTPLHLTCKKNQWGVKCIDIETLKLLLNSGADTTLKNKDGKTALDIFKENNWVEGIKIIEEHINAKK